MAAFVPISEKMHFSFPWFVHRNYSFIAEKIHRSIRSARRRKAVDNRLTASVCLVRSLRSVKSKHTSLSLLQCEFYANELLGLCKNDTSSHGPEYVVLTGTHWIESFVSARQYSIDSRIHTRQCLRLRCCDYLYWWHTAALPTSGRLLAVTPLHGIRSARVYTYRVINKQRLQQSPFLSHSRAQISSVK